MYNCATGQHGSAHHQHVVGPTSRSVSCPTPPRFYSPRFSPPTFCWICSISESSLIPLMKSVSVSSTSRVCFWTKPTWWETVWSAKMKSLLVFVWTLGITTTTTYSIVILSRDGRSTQSQHSSSTLNTPACCSKCYFCVFIKSKKDPGTFQHITLDCTSQVQICSNIFFIYNTRSLITCWTHFVSAK